MDYATIPHPHALCPTTFAQRIAVSLRWVLFLPLLDLAAMAKPLSSLQ